jgi:hypothetical protein
MLPCSHPESLSSLVYGNHRIREMQEVCSSMGFLAESFVGKRETVNQCGQRLSAISLLRERETSWVLFPSDGVGSTLF